MKRYGFTLMEMLVTISIIIIVLAITIPIMLTMTRAFNSAGGKTAVQSAVTAARGYATRVIGDQLVGTDYSGAAALFTPSNEIRLIENMQGASNQDADPVEHLGAARNRWNAYRDLVDRDYIALPSDTLLFGITRVPVSGGGSRLIVLTPPFAVRFNEHGQLMESAEYNSSSVVYYDANDDGIFYTGAGDDNHQNGASRRNPYNMTGTPAIDFRFDRTPYDPDYWNFNNALFRSEVYQAGSGSEPGKYLLPFEAIETVSIVMLASRRAFAETGYDLSAEPNDIYGDLNSDAKDWVMDYIVNPNPNSDGEWVNAEPVMFSRYTGMTIRQ